MFLPAPCCPSTLVPSVCPDPGWCPVSQPPIPPCHVLAMFPLEPSFFPTPVGTFSPEASGLASS